MKLISKEMVLNGLIDWQFTSDDDKEYATIEQMIKSIEETPTVEAIPVEWLKKYRDKIADDKEEIDLMLDAWELYEREISQ